MRQANCAPSSNGLLAPLNPWLQDREVSEILLNQPQEIFVEKYDQVTRHVIPELDERALIMLFQLIANENHQVLNEKKPLLSASLLDGSRIQLVLPPLAKHYTMAIRRHVKKDYSLTDYQQAGVYTHTKPFSLTADNNAAINKDQQELQMLYQQRNWHQFICKAIILKKNIVISGGTSSGKTTFLNACLQQIPLTERIILLEDTREITTAHPNQVNLLSSKGQQGLANVSLQDLLQCSLRLRPDRIIVGEVRGQEVLDFIGACATGHSGSLTTIHANNPRLAFMRMTQLYKLNNVPAMTDQDILREIHEIVDIVIQLARTSQGRCVNSFYYKEAAYV